MPNILACSLTPSNRAKSEIDIELCPRIRSAPPVLDGDALTYVQGLQDMLPPAAARLKARAWRLPANDMRSVGVEDVWVFVRLLYIPNNQKTHALTYECNHG